jgi:transposase InsO family protein
MDMTSVWVAEHAWCYLNAMIDCCTRETAAWSLDCAVAPRRRSPSSTERSQVTASRQESSCSAPTDVGHDGGATPKIRPGAGDPESPGLHRVVAFEAERAPDLWEEFETLDQAREAIGAYVERYHHCPHQFLGYRTPKEVRQT